MTFLLFFLVVLHIACSGSVACEKAEKSSFDFEPGDSAQETYIRNFKYYFIRNLFFIDSPY